MDAQAKRRALPANRRADRQRRARWVEHPPQWLEPAPDTGGDRRHVRTIFISDTHLGTRGCKAEFLLDFLRKHDCDRIYLVGDIVDGWALRRNWYWSETQTAVLAELLRMDAGGTEVVLVCGNHDEFLRRWIDLPLGGVRIVDEATHVLLDGRRLLVLHGDQFDVTIRHAKWLTHLGDRAYTLALWLNDLLAAARRRLGYPYWSLSAWLKARVKEAVKFIDDFERTVEDHARRRGFQGAVCGHIHKAELREENGFLYANDGDWVESCTALVEELDGRLHIVEWVQGDEGSLALRADLPGAESAAAASAVGA
jgi:UDP-2,3-diacylglucosamine pyrophosphatase LpxH